MFTLKVGLVLFYCDNHVYLNQILSLDDLDLVTSAQQDSSPAAQVYLPINIAKPVDLKVKEQQGEGHLSLLYADNVFVPINIERSTEVKDDDDGVQGQTATCTELVFYYNSILATLKR